MDGKTLKASEKRGFQADNGGSVRTLDQLVGVRIPVPQSDISACSKVI